VDLLLALELAPSEQIEIVEFEEFLGAEPDLSLSPAFQVSLLDGGVGEWSELENALDEESVLPLRPIMALLNVEVLEVELPVRENDVLVRESLPHLVDVPLLLPRDLVVLRANSRLLH